EPIDVSVPNGSKLEGCGDRIHVTRRFEPPTVRHQIPVTKLGRTLVDLASELPEARLEQALDSAWRFGEQAQRFIIARVRSLSVQHHRGLRTLKKLIAERDGSTDSLLDGELKRLLWAAGLRRARYNHHVVHDGR